MGVILLYGTVFAALAFFVFAWSKLREAKRDEVHGLTRVVDEDHSKNGSSTPRAERRALKRIENNFVAVLPMVFMDPEAKLVLTTGRWNPESSLRGGDQAIKMLYDPDMQRENLTEPIPPEELKRLEILGPVQSKWRPRRPSERSRSMFSLLVGIDNAGNDVNLVVTTYDSTIISQARRFESIDTPELGDDPWRVLAYMLTSIVEFTEWDTPRPNRLVRSFLTVRTSNNIANRVSEYLPSAVTHYEDGTSEIIRREMTV